MFMLVTVARRAVRIHRARSDEEEGSDDAEFE